MSDTDCFRICYGEADQIPALIVDRYGDYLSIQTLSQTADRQKPLLVDICLLYTSQPFRGLSEMRVNF